MEEVAPRAPAACGVRGDCPQYLNLSEDDYRRPGFEGAKFVMSPPSPIGQRGAGSEGLVRKRPCRFVSTTTARLHEGRAESAGQELGKKDFSKIPTARPAWSTGMLLLWDAVQKGKISENRFVEDHLFRSIPRSCWPAPAQGAPEPRRRRRIVVIDPNKPHTFSVRTTTAPPTTTLRGR